MKLSHLVFLLYLNSYNGITFLQNKTLLSLLSAAAHTLILHLTAPGTFPGDKTVSLPGTFPLLRHIFYVYLSNVVVAQNRCIYGCFKDLFDKSLNVNILRSSKQIRFTTERRKNVDNRKSFI